MTVDGLRDEIDRPLVLPHNPVWRFYEGGRLSRRFRGLPDRPSDFWSEDWVGSCTVASNPSPAGAAQGLSTVEIPGRAPVVLDELVREYPAELLGDDYVRRVGPTTGVLVKLLSPQHAVPVHAHPRPEWARKHLGSAFGKTEAWIFLDVESPPRTGTAGVGFIPGVDRTRFEAAVRRHDHDELRGSLREFEVEVGDVFVARSGTPHCLGGGLSYIELQEPSDDIVIAELDANDDEAFATMGLGWERALDMIDFPGGADARTDDSPRQAPSVIYDDGRSQITALLDEEFWPLFNAVALNVSPAAPLTIDDGRFSILVVTSGSGAITGRFGDVPLSRGMTLVLPALVGATFRASSENFEVVRCLGPDIERMPVTSSPA